MSEIRITATLREHVGKGHSRRARKAGKIPAVLYGHGLEPQHLEFEAREYAHAIKHGMNALLSVQIGSKLSLALTKAIQRDPIKRIINHVDLLAVRRGEKVEVEIPVILTGDAARGSLLNHELTTITVEAEATRIPESVEVSLDGLNVGDHITAADITLPEGSELITEPDAIVVNVQAAPTAEQMEAALESAPAEQGIEDASEPEGTGEKSA
ncbi:MAG: 50S ribosomal protein L25 [Acidimicrobiales bacterium]|nr:MAG: 50S ribosomal protein L25 [Acidimicrobiales bacterium]